ncbi:Cytoplasmic GTPase/eEF2-like protein (ribosomal biogenesis) [Dimargaris verticillata]|uniref:Ribosome assembly protein 1 n=1 Tax=Dimargaris verticillata TaxID=2761393 RepID=A0A9W8B120_9FUNG|nr:Cytoplasmic GTPase/eEF2-like protein (ribosomal biogenesis) [Dimargaris verticillata]
MPVVSAQQLAALLPHTSHVRNICILAHVDHGKTTLSDALLSTNGIISTKIAGKARYLDSREDEQERGITMESSGISLYFKVLRSQGAGSAPDALKAHEYLINLIDSPGHVDFSSEVSTASRLCDGGFVLVDVVEGVCTQTITVLKQAWTESVRPILVLNKMDRLITELRMTPLEAYTHLCQILEQVNAVMATFLTGELLEADARRLEEAKLRLVESGQSDAPDATFDWTLQEMDDSHIYFSPELGNVIFSSAIHGWAFGIRHFARLYAAKLKVKESLLATTLWGDYYFDPKAKRIIPHKQLSGRNLKPMFVQFALDNIWTVYESAVIQPSPEKVEKIVQALGLKVLPRDLRTKDSQALVTTLMTQWLPLSTAVFLTAIDKLPNPRDAQAIRLPRLLHPFADPAPPPKDDLERAMYACDATPKSPIVVFVSKMLVVPTALLPENQRVQLTAEELRAIGRRKRQDATANPEDRTAADGSPLPATNLAASDANQCDNAAPLLDTVPTDDQVLIGFCRLYSGTLTPGQTLYVLSPKYDPQLPPESQPQFVDKVTVGKLYLPMGRDLLPVPQVYAGNVFAMGGLENKVWKSATLTSSLACPSLAQTSTISAPIVRAALEPAHLQDMKQLVEGLRLLNQSDPCVEVFIQESGEHILATAGELHLERCLTDLRGRFARIEIHVSPPIVPFRETVAYQLAGTGATAQDASAVPRGNLIPVHSRGVGIMPSSVVTVTTNNQLVELTLSSRPLPPLVTAFLLEHQVTIRHCLRRIAEKDGSASVAVGKGDLNSTGETLGHVSKHQLLDLKEFMAQLRALFAQDELDSKTSWGAVVDNIWAFGPKRTGPNLWVNNMPDYTPRPWSQPAVVPQSTGHGAETTATTVIQAMEAIQLKDSIERTTAPQPATAGDPSTPSLGRLAIRDLEESLLTGFQLSTLNGPLCAEPMVGLCFTVESCRLVRDPNAHPVDPTGGSSGAPSAYQVALATLPGQVISATREACRQSFLTWSPRLQLAMYHCEIQASADVLGRVYGVIAKRRGRVLSEEMKDGTSIFQIEAKIPVMESFGFADDIRKRTSGAASPQLVFSGYETLDVDPFWVPTTEEELEDLGEKADRENLAKRYVDQVRDRKGMFVEKKIVASAEKQRTLKK